MKWHERLAMVRRYGPPSPTLRHVLEVLVSYDDDAGRFVWPGNKRLAAETGLTGRCVTASLSALVRAGWLKPEKEARESRPADASGREAWWAHGNLGGRRNSTRYRITYRTETLNDVPKQPGTTFRVRKSSDEETLNDVPETLNDVPNNPEPRSGDPLKNHQEQREGYPLPTPHPVAVAADAAAAGAGAPGWPAAARHGIQAAMKQAGCHIADTPSLEAWEGLLQAIGVASDRDVPRVVWDLGEAWKSEHRTKPIRPFAVCDFAAYEERARRSLDARRTFDARYRATRKETA